LDAARPRVVVQRLTERDPEAERDQHGSPEQDSLASNPPLRATAIDPLASRRHGS
jgi:hypothetical protein